MREDATLSQRCQMAVGCRDTGLLPGVTTHAPKFSRLWTHSLAWGRDLQALTTVMSV
jgi:hypothetical protein